MGDLIQSLITPHSSQSSQHQSLHPTSSNESFHSTGSQQPLSSSAGTPHAPRQPNLTTTGKGHLPIIDINAYLADPANAALLASTTASSSKRKANHPQSNSGNILNTLSQPQPKAPGQAPVPLGTTTSHHVPALNTLCQAKGLPTPVYNILPTGDGPDHDVRFSGIVRVDTEIVGSEQRWRNKKEAREGLAERAVPIVTAMPARVRQARVVSNTSATSAAAGGGDGGLGGAGKNWVGLLQEFHNATYGGGQSPCYSYYQVEGKFFAATCVIPVWPGRQFGSATGAFGSKKAAQGAAAQEAVEALMADGKVDDEGVTIAGGRKKSKGGGSGDAGGGGGGPCVRVTDAGLVVSKGASFAQMVNDISPLLGLSAPQYHIEPASGAAPNLLNGYATFNGAPQLKGPVGEARSVYGKKNAREEVAKGVWEILKSVAASRGFEPQEM